MSRAPDGRGLHQWFVGGKLNTCYNALDVHVHLGRGDTIAIQYDSPITGVKRSVTYRELLDEGA